MHNICGRKVWAFPDCELPPAGNFELKGHESVIILNTANEEADITMTLYFADKPPVEGIELKVGAKRVRCLRMDSPPDLGGYVIPRETQYAIGLISRVPIIVQFGRLDTREQPMAFYTNTGYCE